MIIFCNILTAEMSDFSCFYCYTTSERGQRLWIQTHG